jgi:TetR/AcrR family fatty acid metabolism transcriptional regulator
LDAAIVEIARRGYFQTTVSDIARRAGVADGTIYLYFRSKKEILVSIFDRAMDRFIEDGKRELARLEDVEAKLTRLVELHLGLLGQNRDLAVIFQVELRHSLHFMAEFSRSRFREYLGVIAQIVQLGQEKGAFRKDLDPLLAAKAVFGILDEMATDWVLSHRNTRLQASAELVAQLVLAAVRQG